MRLRPASAVLALVVGLVAVLVVAVAPQALPDPGPGPGSAVAGGVPLDASDPVGVSAPVPACEAPPRRLAFAGEAPHPPIRVDGNAPNRGFTVDAEAGPAEAAAYRPGSGVVAGDGTEDDPYVIAGWTTPRIVVENTTAHVHVQQNTIRLQGPQSQETNDTVPEDLFDALIEVRNASNVSVAHNTVDRRYRNYRLGSLSHVRPSIAVYESRGVTVTENRIRRAGIPEINPGGHALPLLVDHSRDVCLRANAVEVPPLSAAGGLQVRHSHHVHVRDHDLHPLRTLVVDSPHVRLTDNTLGGTTLDSSPHATLRDNAFPDMRGLTLREKATTATLPRWEDRRDPALLIRGDRPRDWDHTIPPSNTVRGEPLRYVSEAQGATVRPPAGQVVLHNTTGATVQEVNVTTPILSGFTAGTTVRNVTVDDVHTGPHWPSSLYIQDATGFTVNNSTVRDALVWVHRSEDVRVANTTFAGSGLRIETSDRVRLHELRFVRPLGTLVAFRSTDNATVTETRLHSGTVGVSMVGTPENITIRNTTFDGFLHAMRALNGRVRNLTLVDDVFRDIKLSIVRTRFPMEVHGNNIWDGFLEHYDDEDEPDTPPTDARRNWWGCPEGPSNDECNDARGLVEVDPWLTEPNPEAGAD